MWLRCDMAASDFAGRAENAPKSVALRRSGWYGSVPAGTYVLQVKHTRPALPLATPRGAPPSDEERA